MTLYELIPALSGPQRFVTLITNGIRTHSDMLGLGIASEEQVDPVFVLMDGYDASPAAPFTGLSQDAYETLALDPSEFGMSLMEHLPDGVPRWIYNRKFFDRFLGRDDAAWDLVQRGPVLDVGEVAAALQFLQFSAANPETYTLETLAYALGPALYAHSAKAESFKALCLRHGLLDPKEVLSYPKKPDLLKSCVDAVLRIQFQLV